MDRTHAVWLRQGVVRDDTSNNNTINLDQALRMGLVDLRPPAPSQVGPSFRDRFIAHYDAIRELCERPRSPGLALFAIDSQGLAASALLVPQQDRCTSAIIGRHSMAELYLPGDPTLSLRHLAVIVRPPACGADEVRYRLVDLRTADAFSDENGRRLEAFEAEGPVFVSCARYSLFLLPAGGDLLWPDRGIDAWDCIPERVYLGDRPAEPDRWERRRQRRRPTHVLSLPGPLLAGQRMLAEHEPPLAELRIASSRGMGCITVGPTALEQGVLLGRAPRCDNELGVLSLPQISRVHTLVLEVDGEVYAVDAASTHGLWRAGERVRTTRLTPGCELQLDTLGTRVRWEVLQGRGTAN